MDDFEKHALDKQGVTEISGMQKRMYRTWKCRQCVFLDRDLHTCLFRNYYEAAIKLIKKGKLTDVLEFHKNISLFR